MNDYARVEKAIRFLKDSYLDHPDLRTVAAVAGVSEFYFQRLFSRWAGISPKAMLQLLTAQHAKALLRDSRSVGAQDRDAHLGKWPARTAEQPDCRGYFPFCFPSPSGKIGKIMTRQDEEKTLSELAKEGIDLPQLYERLSWTPTERLVRNYDAATAFEELRKAGQRHRDANRR